MLSEQHVRSKQICLSSLLCKADQITWKACKTSALRSRSSPLYISHHRGFLDPIFFAASKNAKGVGPEMSDFEPSCNRHWIWESPRKFRQLCSQSRLLDAATSNIYGLSNSPAMTECHVRGCLYSILSAVPNGAGLMVDMFLALFDFLPSRGFRDETKDRFKVASLLSTRTHLQSSMMRGLISVIPFQKVEYRGYSSEAATADGGLKEHIGNICPRPPCCSIKSSWSGYLFLAPGASLGLPGLVWLAMI